MGNVTFGLGLSLILLGGCNLESAVTACATCGEVRSITPRAMRSDIHLLTSLDAYRPTTVPAAGAAMMFHVRVRMDRGGSRDFFLPQADVSVGNRVEVRGDALVVRDAKGMRWS